MDKDNTENDITTSMRRIRWKSIVDQMIDRFEGQFSKSKLSEPYDSVFVERASERYRSAWKLQFRIYLLYLLGNVLLLLALRGETAEISLFGYLVKLNSVTLSLALLVVSVMGFFGTLLSIYSKYLEKIVTFILKKKFGEDADFIAPTFFYDLPRILPGRKHQYTHALSTVLLLLPLLSFVFLSISVSLVALYIQTATARELVSSFGGDLFSGLLIAMCLVALATNWLATFIALPLPIDDYSGTFQLSKLKEKQPDKFEEQMRLHARKLTHSYNRIWNSAFGFGLVVYFATAVNLIYLRGPDESHWNPTKTGIFIGVFITSLLFTEGLGILKQILWTPSKMLLFRVFGTKSSVLFMFLLWITVSVLSAILVAFLNVYVLS